MINSFWNICSTCPMPKEEKLNSEYKRNYVWHPHYRPLAQDVVSTAPQSVIKEAGRQQRKQYPELAYKNHEVIRHDLGYMLKDATDSRARSEERDLTLSSKAGPRSRSADPGINQHKSIMVQSFPPITAGRVSNLPRTEEIPNISEQPSETSEYKSKFAWPVKSDEEPPCIYRKSVSMNVIKSSEDTVDFAPKSKMAPVHRPCVKHKEAEKAQDSKYRKVKTEYKAKYKPFASYVYVDGEWKKTSRLLRVAEKVEDHVEPWFVEVTERLQKANEYRWRGQGHPVIGDALPDIYKQTPEIPPQRPKRLPIEMKLTQPKCHQASSKKVETSKKKEGHSESASDKKTDKEPRKQSMRRPKSAEPAKAKETVKYKRPATTPPAKLTTQSLPPRKRMPKVDEAEKPKAKTSRKPKEESSAKALSAPKKAPSSTSQSSGGKVWLQAGPSGSDSTGKDDPPPVKEHSDAVGPSSLSPIKSAAVVQEAPVYNDVDSEKNKVQKEEPTSYVPQSNVVPLTHVRTPEEVTGVKSPDPENWTVPIENSERLQWSGDNTIEASKIKTPEEVAEKLSKIDVADVPVPTVAETQESGSSNSGKITSANVLDRARSRLDQFWGKNK